MFMFLWCSVVSVEWCVDVMLSLLISILLVFGLISWFMRWISVDLLELDRFISMKILFFCILKEMLCMLMI